LANNMRVPQRLHRFDARVYAISGPQASDCNTRS
jgi:hypothetical protein